MKRLDEEEYSRLVAGLLVVSAQRSHTHYTAWQLNVV